MTKEQLTLEDVAAYVVGLFPKLNLFEQRLSLELYRLLSQGRPVPRTMLAQRLGCGVEVVNEIIDRWPGVFCDEKRQIVGYGGLSIPAAYASPHKMMVADQNLSAWCAWDTLFLPELLGQATEVESTSPEGSRILLKVTSARVEHKYPIDMRMSFLLPDAAAVEKDVLKAFCHFVHFFPSPEVGQRWTTQHPGTFLLSIDEAYSVAHRKNQMQYPHAFGVAELTGLAHNEPGAA